MRLAQRGRPRGPVDHEDAVDGAGAPRIGEARIVEARPAHGRREQRRVGPPLNRVVEAEALESGRDAVPERDVALEHRAARVRRDHRREQLVLMTGRGGEREAHTGGKQDTAVRHGGSLKMCS